LQLVGAKAETLNSIGKFEELTAELEAISTRLSEEIFEYWSQNKYLKVNFQFAAGRPADPAPYNTGFVFHTRIANTRHGVTVSFDDRSAGFVWFFSFLVWFSQLKKTFGERLFILLDDPGLSLHARAQGDLLRYIKEKLEPQYQVMYTTHSPFMIDPEKLMCVRTIEDVVTSEEVLGSKVGDRMLSIDPDTVFPLQAALGYDITQTLFVGPHTLLVEGPSDLLYLKLFSKGLQEAGREYLDPRWVITPCGGVEKIGSFIALFGGNRLHIAVLTDYHVRIKNKVRNLRESDLLKSGHVFSAEMYVDGDEADMEDIIGRSNYVMLINECYSLVGTKMLPEAKAATAPLRVIEEVENHFGQKVTGTKFDHFTPALFLIENRNKLQELPQLGQALDRFEKIFKDLNQLLPKE
jgi:predicted ATP-dependent endonuclease of OLD family